MMCDKCCCNAPHFLKFKLSLMGLMTAFILALASIIPPYKSLLVKVPLPLLLSVLVAIPSVALYYNVRDKFWSEVAEKNKEKK